MRGERERPNESGREEMKQSSVGCGEEVVNVLMRGHQTAVAACLS